MQTFGLHLILAILILTNPVCCQMFGSVKVVRSEEPVAECCGCGCEREPCEPSSNRKEVPHAPCGCPNCDLCQCICAGAIVTDAVTVDNSHDQAQIDMIADHPTDAASVLLHAPVSFCDAQMACAEANVGRSARILYGSLLC